MKEDQDRCNIVVENNGESTDSIFVVGAPRSGTTLLAGLIARHQDVCYLEESGLFFRFFPRLPLNREYSIIASLLPSDLKFFWFQEMCKARIMRPVIGLVWRRYSGANQMEIVVRNMLAYSLLGSVPHIRPRGKLTEELGLSGQVDESKVANLCRKYNDIKEPYKLFRTLLGDFSILSKKSRVLEKSPHHYRHVPDILGVFPGARIVNIIRDGRPVVASMVHKDFLYSKSQWKTACKAWKEAVWLNRYYEKKYGGNYMSVRFEDLTSAPQKTLEEVFAFLGLKPSGSTADYADITDKKPDDEDSKWKTVFSRKVRDRITEYLLLELKDLGYIP